MKSKEKKKAKKKNKTKKPGTGKPGQSSKFLEKSLKKLQKEIRVREEKIELLNQQLKTRTDAKKTGEKQSPSWKSSDTSVAMAQRRAWKRHGYLRDRYEYHLESGQEKHDARLLADKDLRAEYGEETGYTEDELHSILS
ncbi:MAG: hypothetical protein GY703_03595 [Gammaproteobacteria bacterium]|nr:hypothetical protein [Gammaproteobacteria bacterium]